MKKDKGGGLDRDFTKILFNIDAFGFRISYFVHLTVAHSKNYEIKRFL